MSQQLQPEFNKKNNDIKGGMNVSSIATVKDYDNLPSH